MSSEGRGRCPSQATSAAGAACGTAITALSATSRAKRGSHQLARSWQGGSTANPVIHSCRTSAEPRVGRLTWASRGKIPGSPGVREPVRATGPLPKREPSSRPRSLGSRGGVDRRPA